MSDSTPFDQSDPTVTPHHVAGVGASAGGLEALERFVSQIPPDSGMAYVVVQHLSPDYKSMMAELLSKRTTLQVTAAQHEMRVGPDTIYVIPPKHNITIRDGALLLSDQDHSRGLNLPIDIFFRSLAEDQGDRAVGIVLSGTGSDGMRGVRSIKAEGGLVMVQDIESAKFDGMPASAISTGVADFVLPPEEMPERLLTWIQHPYVAREADTSALRTNEQYLMQIFDLLQKRHQINFAYYKMTTVMRRLERRITVCRLESVSEYIRYLQEHPREVTALYRELLIGVTSFFRDPDAFAQLRETGLDELLEAKEQGEEFRVWVTGCSTGEEAYSLAILIDQVLREKDLSVDVKIFATDIDQDSLSVAAAGRYPASIAGDIPQDVLTRYFQKHGESFQISRTIRDNVVFAQHNLVGDPPFTNIDLISCRNLLIYLQPVLQRKALELFNFSMRAGGILFLGSSETIGEMHDYFEPLHNRWRIYRSRGRRSKGVTLEMRQPPEWQRTAREPASYSGGGTRSARQDEALLSRFLNRASGDYLPPAVIVNDRNELQHVVGNVALYLRLPDGRMQNDITKMGRAELTIPLATGLQKALAGSDQVRYGGIVLKDGDEQARQIRLRFVRLPERAHQDTLVAIFFENDSTAEPTDADAGSEPYDLNAEMRERIHDLEQDLQFTRENLQATIEELETSNEELQATNEELLASNEELQSTNEELQAANEEIHTVNAENQARIIELTNLSNDLENLLTNSDIGQVVLDENLEIRLLSRNISDLTNIRASDSGRPLRDIRVILGGVDLADVAEQVATSSEPWEDRLHNASGRPLLVRVRPYQVAPDTYSGVLITLIDISELHGALDELARTKERLELAFEGTDVAWWDWDRSTGTVTASDRKFTLLGYEPGHTPSNVDDWIDRIHPEDKPAAMKSMRDLLAGEAPRYQVEYRLRTEDGGWRWFRDDGRVVSRDAEGQAQRVIGSVRPLDEGCADDA